MNPLRFALAFWAAVVAASAAVLADEPARQRAADLAPPVQLTAGGKPIDVGGFAAPFVGDFNEDGKHDLLVGQRDLGRLRIYLNLGSNTRPEFESFEWFTAGGQIAGVPPCCIIAFTPQLVDFNGDGRTDILTGSGVCGEAFLYRRMPDLTFDAAEVLENADGHVQMHRCSIRRAASPRRYNVTALAYDWDADGDQDLLMGHYPVCLVLNTGTAQEPSFDGGRRIECDGKPIRGGLASPHMADWDGDGRDDLLTGLSRDIVWYRNVGERGRPKFESPRLLVPLIKRSPAGEPTDGQPDFFHAFCVTDFNSDGRLDLLLGDRFSRRVEVSPAERDKALANRERLDTLREKYNDLWDKPERETRPQRIERYRLWLQAYQEYGSLLIEGRGTSNTRSEHHGHVWFYERLPSEGEN